MSVESYQWVPYGSQTAQFWDQALIAGAESHGSLIYVGRMSHYGDLLPASIVPDKQEVSAAYAGGQIFSNTYDILIGTHFGWIESSNGAVPAGAIPGGRTAGGEKLFIGRVHHDGRLAVGKIHPSHRNLYVPFQGKELHYSHYEVLVDSQVTLPTSSEQECHVQWISTKKSNQTLPLDTVSSYGNLVGRVFYKSDFLPAEIGIDGIARYCDGDKIVTSDVYELLTGKSFSWIQGSYGSIPPEAVPSGKNKFGEWLFIGRTSSRIGVVHPSRGYISIPNGSQGLLIDSNYEVLVQRREMPPDIPRETSSTNGNCCVCWENEAVMVVVPCGNLCLCVACSRSPHLERCPVCRGPKMNCIRVYKT